MIELQRAVARQHLEQRFRAAIDSDVSGLAVQTCLERGWTTPDGTPAHLYCLGSHPAITQLVFEGLRREWTGVVYIYDGLGQAPGRYTEAKLRLTLALARSGDEVTPEVETALLRAHAAVNELWRVWAGFEATTRDELAPAVTEFEIS